MTDEVRPVEPRRVKTIRELRELIMALDRRVPHVERVGEVEIARPLHVVTGQSARPAFDDVLGIPS